MEGLDNDRARRKVERKDAERDAFIRRFFGEQIDDPLNFKGGVPSIASSSMSSLCASS